MSCRHTRTRPAERGASMMELVVASTIFSVVMVSTFASSGSFSDTLKDQMTVQDQFISANVTRMRILGDADSSTSASCPLPDRLTLGMATPPGAFIDYMVSQGKLYRYNSVPDHWSVLAEGTPSLTCNDLGTDGIYAGIELGTAELPYHLHVRISAGGGGA